MWLRPSMRAVQEMRSVAEPPNRTSRQPVTTRADEAAVAPATRCLAQALVEAVGIGLLLVGVVVAVVEAHSLWDLS